MTEAPPPILYRVAVATDATAIAHAHAASWRVAYRGVLRDRYLEDEVVDERLALWQQRFEVPHGDQQHVIVAERAGRLEGFVCAYAHDDAEWGTHLDNIHVAASARGQGIGRRLMAQMAAWSLQVAPAAGLFLWVVEQNSPAIGFYESLGGVACGRDLWDAPGGGRVPIVRYAWKNVRELRQRGLQQRQRA